MFGSCYCINSTVYLLKFGKLYGTLFCYSLAVSERVHIFLNIRLPGPSASRISRWLPLFDSTSMFRSDSTRWLLYNCRSAKWYTNPSTKTEKGLPLYAIISMQNEPNPFLCHPEVLEAEILEHVFFHNCFTLSRKNMKTALFSILFHDMMTYIQRYDDVIYR